MPKNKKLPRLKKRLATLNEETKKQKEAILVQLTKYPIVEVACNKTNVGRSTYYDWRKKDAEFSKMADKALNLGIELITDMAQSGLIKNIQSGSNTAIIFWLKNHHGGYSDKITHQHEIVPQEITQEQADRVNFAIHNIGMGSILKMNQKAQERLEENIAKGEQKNMTPEARIAKGILREKELKPPTEKELQNANIKVGSKKAVNLEKFFNDYEERRKAAQERLKQK